MEKKIPLPQPIRAVHPKKIPLFLVKLPVLAVVFVAAAPNENPVVGAAAVVDVVLAGGMENEPNPPRKNWK